MVKPFRPADAPRPPRPPRPPSPRPPAPPRSAARRLPAAQRKDAILAAALPLFATRGSEGTTTRDLAKAAGVTEPILYRHFPSKADLFAAVVARAADRIVGEIDGAVRPARGAAARLVALAQRLEPLLAELDDEFRVLNGAAATHADAPTTALLRDVYARIGSALTRALAGGGLAPGVTAEVAAHLLLELGLGASLVRPLGVPAVVRDGYGENVLRLLVATLTPRRAR